MDDWCAFCNGTANGTLEHDGLPGWELNSLILWPLTLTFCNPFRYFRFKLQLCFKSAVVDRVCGLRNYPVLIVNIRFKARHRAVHFRVQICAAISERHIKFGSTAFKLLPLRRSGALSGGLAAVGCPQHKYVAVFARDIIPFRLLLRGFFSFFLAGFNGDFFFCRTPDPASTPARRYRRHGLRYGTNADHRWIG